MLGAFHVGLEVHDVLKRIASLGVLIAAEKLLLELRIGRSNIAFLAGPFVDLGGAGPGGVALRGGSVESVVVELLIFHPTVGASSGQIFGVSLDA